MDKQNAGVVFILLLTCVLAGQAVAQSSGIKFNSNADDLMKINSVLEQFRQDIVHKNGYALTKLVLNSNVLFHSVNSQAEVDSARKYNAQFDGIGPSALDGFAQFLATSKDKLEETFHNIEIHQDGDLGLATFNYDFLVNDKVTNSGVEHWILCRVDGQWKILSLVWTSYDAKNQATHATAKQMALLFPNALRLIEMRKRAGIHTILSPWSWLNGASRNLVGFGLIAGIRARCKEF